MAGGLRRGLLFFVTEDWYFCSHRLALAVAARKAGWEVGFVGRVRRHGEKIRAQGIAVHPLEISRGSMNPLHDARVLRRLVGILRRVRPALMHTVAWKPAIHGALAARIAGVPCRVHALAGMGYAAASQSAKARLLRALLPGLLRVARGGWFIAQNPDDARQIRDWLGLDATHMRLIRGSGVDVGHFRPLPEPPAPPFVFALPARMLRDKGVEEFVEAMRILRARALPVEGWLVGGVDRENPAAIPEARLRAWEEEGAVRWLGHQEDMRALWARAHVAVLPSYREGLPKALLEAAACGRALVAADVPGCREIVRHEETGLFVPARDARALAEAMQRLAEDAALRRRLGAQARRVVEAEFAEGIVIRETLALYEEIWGQACASS